MIKNNEDSFRLAVRSIPTASKCLARERVIWGRIFKALVHSVLFIEGPMIFGCL